MDSDAGVLELSMIRTLVIFFLASIVIQSGSVPGKSQARRQTNNGQSVERADSHRHLAATFADVAKLKIVARKTNYHVGEMITVDIALLSTSSRPLLVPRLSEVRFSIRNSGGQSIAVQGYGVADRALVPSAFVRLPPNEMILRSFQLLVGCDRRAFSQAMAVEHDSATLFGRGLFLSWGDACLPIDHSITLTISAEIKNAFVVFSREKDKTAVGTINSNTLELRIDESK
jgi:hypothetical protein